MLLQITKADQMQEVVAPLLHTLTFWKFSKNKHLVSLLLLFNLSFISGLVYVFGLYLVTFVDDD